jgi:hypothetical protein
VLVAVGDPGIRELHRGVQLGGSVEVEVRLPRDGVRHWARELYLEHVDDATVMVMPMRLSDERRCGEVR